MSDPTWVSLLPPLVAIGLALTIQRVVLPLAGGVLIAAGLLAGTDQNSTSGGGFLGSAWDWGSATLTGFVTAIIQSVGDDSHVQVLAFSLLLGAMVGVLESGGAMRSLLGHVAGLIRGRRSAQSLIAVSGLAVFFDDYANTLLIGGAYRSTADRFRISRAKLAYLVDSTAAPVAGLALVSTWVATEISYLESGLQAAGVADRSLAFGLFIQSIPYRFYPLLALAMVFVVAASGRDIGPMRVVENDAAGNQTSGDANALPQTRTGDLDVAKATLPASVVCAIAPVLACVTAVAIALVLTGYRSLAAEGKLPMVDSQAALEAGPPAVGPLQAAGQIIGAGDSYVALVIGGAVGLAAALLLAASFRIADAKSLIAGVIRGAAQMMPAMLVLWLAWALSTMTDENHLNTGSYLAGILDTQLSAAWLPTSVFLLSGIVAFSTGTSWGTMALLTPIAVSLAIQMDPSGDPAGPINLATFGSVLAGAIFGDHCSPISDTTVLSSRACGCDHLLHVKTQMPYAILVAVVCMVLGTIPAGFGVSPLLSLALGTVAIIVIVRLLGQPPSRDQAIANGSGES